MARSGGRSGGGFSRPASKPSKCMNAFFNRYFLLPRGIFVYKRYSAPVKAPAPPQSPSTTGGLGSVVAEGMAFGGGSAIAHRAVDAIVGPRVVHHETVASAAQVPNTGTLDACVSQYKAFEDCLKSNGNDISRCQFYMDMLAECRKATSGSGSFMA